METNARILILKGRLADGSLFDDSAEAIGRIQGVHKYSGLKVRIVSQKANCGGYNLRTEVIETAEQRPYFDSGMMGCWQVGHQWPSDGDPTLDLPIYTVEDGQVVRA